MGLRDELHRLIDTVFDAHESGDPLTRQEAHDAADTALEAHDQADAEHIDQAATATDEPAPPPKEAQEAINPNVPGGDVVRTAEGEPVVPGASSGAELTDADREAIGKAEPGAQP